MAADSDLFQGWPADGLEAVGACPLCGAVGRTLAHDGLRDYVFQCAGGTWRMFLCTHCESGYLDPRPTQETIALAYQRYYTHQPHVPVENWLRALWRMVRDDYFQAAFGVPAHRRFPLGRWLVRSMPLSCHGLDTVMARNLEGLAPPGGRLLDVGCGNGAYLDFARRAGWKVRGLDFDPLAVAAAQELGLDVQEGGIELLDGESEAYDRITLSHVLEHVYDPVSLLSSCHRLLKKDGVLWLETPNMGSFGRSVFGKAWRGLEPPRHLHLFSRRCLQEQLKKIGFSNIEDKFNVLAIKGMWRESNEIATIAGLNKGLMHSVMGQFVAEVRGMVNPNSKEFITLSCVKGSDV